jgi:phosphoesterase RecJ-like protein
MSVTNEQWAAIQGRLSSWKRVVLLSHERPDGDAIGSLVATARLLGRQGVERSILLYDAPPGRYAALLAGEPVVVARGSGAVLERADGIVVLDTCAWSQLEPVAACLREAQTPRLVVDHHKTRDGLAGAGVPVEYAIDESAAATALLVYEWAATAGWLDGADGPTLEALFVGIATDTGWFRFSNTDARALHAVAELVRRGVPPDRWYARLYESASAARLRLEGAMLGSLQTRENGRVVYATLTKAMFHETGANPAETEDMIHLLQRAADAAVVVLFAETDDRVRVSLRSKPPPIGECDIDVATIARRLGGGGHARAAGVRLEASLDDARERVLAAVHRALDTGATPPAQNAPL